MKFTFKSLLTLVAAVATMSLHAEDVVKVQVCRTGADAFLFGCQQFTGTGVHPGIDVGGETKTLDIRFGAPSSSEVNVTLNEGETFLYGCNTYTPTKDTTITETFTNVSGCDSTVNVNVTMKAATDCKTEEVINVTLEQGQTFLYGCNVYTPTKDTTIIETLTNVAGCDSTVTINVTMKAASCATSSAVEANLTLGQTFLFQCQEITPSKAGDTVVVETLANANAAGCDSIITLTLHVLDETCIPTTSTIDVTLEEGQTFLYGCNVYTPTKDTVITETLTNVAGCDSTVTINVTIANGCLTSDDFIDVDQSLLTAQVGKFLDVTAAETKLMGDYATWNATAGNEQVTGIRWEYSIDNGVTYNALTAATVMPRTMSEQLVYVRYTPISSEDCAELSKIAMVNVQDITREVKDNTTTTCAGEFVSRLQTLTLTVDTAWNDTVYDIFYADGLQFFDSVYTYHITLNEAYTAIENDTICPDETAFTYIDGNDYVPGTYTINLTAANGCDSIVTLNVYQYTNTLPALDGSNMPHAVCGYAYDVATLINDITATTSADPLFVKNATFSVEVKGEDGTWAAYDGLGLPANVDNITLRVAGNSDCGNFYSNEVVLPIEQATPDNMADHDLLPAGTKYGGWILMINLNYVRENCVDANGNALNPKPENVLWYRQVGATVDTENDEYIGSGYYYTPDKELPAGNYYGIINLDANADDPCGSIWRTVVVVSNPVASAPKLLPNRVEIGETMELIYLDPTVETTVRVYDAEGRMLQSITTQGESTIQLKAVQTAGMYLVKVESETQSEVLRYIVK